MKKSTRVFSTLVLITAVSVILAVTTGCTVREYQMYEPKVTPVQIPSQADQLQGKQPQSLLKPPVDIYTFNLTPSWEERPELYTRKEVENFLCTMAPHFIQASDVYRMARTSQFVIETTKTLLSRKEKALQQEITKWFEPEVSVTTRGNITPLDRRSVSFFFSEVNRIIGHDKFIYTHDLPVANIVIETAPPNTANRKTGPIGETAILEDNLRVRISIKNNKVQVDTYLVGLNLTGGRSGQVVFTPGEKKWAKTNRLVKIYLGNIIEPLTRHRSLVHEMLHAIGLPGHSPYPSSHLFPYPVDIKNRGLAQPLLSQFSAGMVALLYRPEMVPGMTVKDTAALLETLKRKELTTTRETIAYLQKKKQELAILKQDLLKETTQSYSQRMHLFLKLDKLLYREQHLLEELEEARADNRLDTRMVDRIAMSPSLSVKLSRIRTALILLKNKRNTLARTEGKTSRGIKLCDEQIIVLNDLLKIAGKIAAAEAKIEASKAFRIQHQLETRMRRIVRQITFIDRQLDALQRTGEN